MAPPSQRGEALDGAITLGRMAHERLEAAQDDARAALGFLGSRENLRPQADMARRLLDTIAALQR
jgi:hypothetical protein